MKKEILMIAFVMAFLVGGSIIVLAEIEGPSLSLSVDLKEPLISVELGESNVDFGNITKGYKSGINNISVVNNGDVEIDIVPLIDEGDPEVFEFLEFNTGACSDHHATIWNNILSWDGLNIKKPAIYQGIRESYFCIRLNLEEYDPIIPEDQTLTTDLTFWITPA
jgi:hypothetical protein